MPSTTAPNRCASSPPSQPGRTLHARNRVVRAEAKSGGTLVTVEWDVRVVGAEKPAVLYRMQTLYR